MKFPVNWEIQLEFINVAYDNTHERAQILHTHTHTHELPRWQLTEDFAGLQVAPLVACSPAGPGAGRLQLWACSSTQQACHTGNIFSASFCDLERVGRSSYQQQKYQNKLRSHFKVVVTKRKFVRTLKKLHHWEEAIIPPNDMNKLTT